MKLRLEQLTPHLEQQLAPCYLLSGTEYCLVADAALAIREKAFASGFTERETVTVEASFNWHQLFDNLQTLSLFASRKLVEVHLPSGKPGDSGSQFIQRYMAQPNLDILLVFILGKVESATTRSKWWLAIEKTGVTLQIWPLDQAGLRRGLTQQLRQVQLTLEPAALELLLAQTQGNLLAARQEIQKLSLLFAPGSTLSSAQLSSLLHDCAEFTVFDLVDRCNDGNAAAILHTLKKLHLSGVEPILIIWAITRELRQLHTMKQALQQGTYLATLLQQYRLPLQRKPMVEKALSRLTSAHYETLLLQAANIDAIIKGNMPGQLWPALTSLCLNYGGHGL